MLYSEKRVLKMQLEILMFFQEIQNPVLSFLAKAVTLFGEAAIPLLIIVCIYWNIDKKKGFALISEFLSATIAMQIIKAVFRVQRPFAKHPELIKAQRVETATGYSFPSGHSTTAASFYGGIARLFRSPWTAIPAALLIILVPLSRLYLGVHWPLDVITGTVLGLVFAIALPPVLLKLYEKRRAFLVFTFTYGSIAFLLSAALALLLDLTSIDRAAVKNLMENSAIAGGAFLGLYLDRKFLNFKTDGSIRRKTTRYILGLASGLLIAGLIMMVPVLHHTMKFLALSFAGMYLTFLFPLIAVKSSLMEMSYEKAR